MNIGIDIDDTITSTFEYMMPYVADFFGLDYAVLKKEQISYSNLPAMARERLLDFAKATFDSTAASTPAKEHAAEVIRAWKEEGHRITIITGRSNAFYTDCYKTTEEELENCHIVYDKLICTMDKKRACMEEGIDLLIDDSVRNLEGAKELGIRTILFDSPANKDDREFERVFSWEELRELVK